MSDSDTSPSPITDDGALAGSGDVDAMLEGLANARRRDVLSFIGAEGTPVELQDLTEYLASVERGRTPLAADTDHLAIRLHHVDLPALADAGLIEYDLDRQVVEATDVPADLRTVLE